jgi:hypothetical protein
VIAYPRRKNPQFEVAAVVAHVVDQGPDRDGEPEDVGVDLQGPAHAAAASRGCGVTLLLGQHLVVPADGVRDLVGDQVRRREVDQLADVGLELAVEVEPRVQRIQRGPPVLRPVELDDVVEQQRPQRRRVLPLVAPARASDRRRSRGLLSVVPVGEQDPAHRPDPGDRA